MLIDSNAADFATGEAMKFSTLVRSLACLLITTVITITITIVMGRLFIASAREQRRRVSERTGLTLRPNLKGHEEPEEGGRFAEKGA